jgi:hypothetical protein
MKLWLVSTDYCSYDEYDSFVIRAETELDARAIADAQPDGSGHKTGFWNNTEKVTVTEITAEGEPEVILGSFNAG